MKQLLLITIFILLCKVLLAPEARRLMIERAEKIDPFKKVIEAISWVESRHNDNAINWKEMSVGRFQIRQIRLDDYFQRAGVRFTLPDMLEAAKAEEVIRYYARQFGAYRIDEFTKSWNGRGKKAEQYLLKVKQALKK